MADCAGQILTIIKADESIMDSSAWIFCTIYNGEIVQDRHCSQPLDLEQFRVYNIH